MDTLKNITSILITLSVGGNQVLFILLDQDGTINRKGDGKPDCKDNNVFLGITKDKLFEQLVPYVTEDMEQFVGKAFDIPEKKGRICEYQVLFAGPGIETGCRFVYGEFSQGIPGEFRKFTIKAIDLTEDWFQAFSKAQKRAAGHKPWWQFW